VSSDKVSICALCSFGTNTIHNGKSTYYCRVYERYLSPYTIVKRCKYFSSKAKSRSKKEQGKAVSSGLVTQTTLTQFFA